MVLIGQDTIEIYEEVRDSEACGFDEYGKPKKCEVLVETVIGSLQGETPTEIETEHGTSTQDAFTAILPITTNISRNSKLKNAEYGGYFKVVGEPQKWNTLIPHIMVKLVKER